MTVETKTYRIVRFYKGDHDRELLAIGQTLEEVQAHCRGAEASSETATSEDALARTEAYGSWFDGYYEE